MKSKETDILIVGAGIAGLAHAYAAAVLGYRVVVVEKDLKPSGASVKNFGLIWPIGQSPGTAYSLAIKSTQIWKKLAKEADFWLKQSGSVFLAKYDAEMEVLKEFQESAYKYGYKCKLINAKRTRECVGEFATKSLKGALLSDTELTVNPLKAIPSIIEYLRRKYGVSFVFGKAVTRIEMPFVLAGKYVWKTNQVFICSGDVTAILYPEKLASKNLQNCQLHMMSGTIKNQNLQKLPALATGLSIIRYPSFRHCSSLENLRVFLTKKAPLAIEHGINLLVSTYKNNKIVIGDSHHYNNVPTFTLSHVVKKEILKQLKDTYHIPDLEIEQEWLGNYLKTIGGSVYNLELEEGVKLVTGLGGNGMTLSFGLAEENLREYHTANMNA